jgi:hypothetical protein
MPEIEKNIPLPTNARQANRNGRIAPWEKMEIGDSLFFGKDDLPEGKTFKDLRQSIYNAARKYGSPKEMFFTALVVEEERPDPMGPTKVMVEGVRIWRTNKDGSLTPPEPTRTQEGSQLSENERNGGIDAEAA